MGAQFGIGDPLSKNRSLSPPTTILDNPYKIGVWYTQLGAPQNLNFLINLSWLCKKFNSFKHLIKPLPG